MGKNADNEQLKLKATYHNNISVGLFVTGVSLPQLALFLKAPQIAAVFETWRNAKMISISETDLAYVVAVVAAIVAAMWAANYHRKRADQTIRMLLD